MNNNEILLVAGAGGGSGGNNTPDKAIEYVGGYGGPTASDGKGNDYAKQNRDKVNFTGKGATASYPGKGGIYTVWNNNNEFGCAAEDGSQFFGGTACAISHASAGGGGSGYYGGGGGADVAGGGGGSSYASPKMGSVLLMNGNTFFADQNGQAELGHIGNGFAIIEESFEEYIYRPCPVVICSDYEKFSPSSKYSILFAAVYS